MKDKFKDEKVFNKILEIEKRGEFHKGFTLIGYHEVVDALSDFERAVYTLAMNIIDSDIDESKKHFQVTTISGLLWFYVIDRLALWEKPNYYAINKGKNIVIVDEESMKAASTQEIKLKKVNSIDDLPEKLRNTLLNLVLSSSHGEAGKGPISNN